MNFLTKISKPAGSFALIAEIKLKSPTEGDLGASSDVAEIAKQYQEGGVDALSVVTEKNLFGGNLKLIQRIKKVGNLPIICKDFVTDERKLREIADAGADAVLLLARLLGDRQLKSFSQTAIKCKMLPVIEADNLIDLKRMITGKYPVVAVNARNLGDLSVNRKRACRMLEMIPEKVFKLAFSGVRDVRDIKNYLRCGAYGILVGTALMKSETRIQLIKEFKSI